MKNILLGIVVLGFLVIFGLVTYELGRQSVTLNGSASMPPIPVRNGSLTAEPPLPVSLPDGQVVGNDRDAHGCIGSAGYSWCNSKAKCLRIWEESCPLPGESEK